MNTKRACFLLGIVALAPFIPKVIWAQKATPLTLKAAGSTYVYPLLTEKWIKAYKAKTGVQIDYQAIGSGGGIQQFVNGNVDFAASDAPLNRRHRAEIKFPVHQVPSAGMMVAIAYHLPGVKGTLRLDGPTLADIYLGKIQRWDDKRLKKLNPNLKLPARQLVWWHRSDGSGTSYIFTHYLSQVSPEWKRSVGAGKSVDWPTGIGLKGFHAEAVKSSPYSLAYIEFNYAKTEKLSIAEIKNAAGQFVAPTLRGGQSAIEQSAARFKVHDLKPFVNAPGVDSYPITGVTTFVMRKNNRDSQQRARVLRFLQWTLTEGQKSNESLGYPALPNNVRQSLLRQLNLR